MYSEKEIQKLLHVSNVNIGKSQMVTKEDRLRELLHFAAVGNPNCPELDKHVNDINFLDLFRNMDYSSTALPKESRGLSNCITIEKYKKIVERIIIDLKNGNEVALNGIMEGLGYYNLCSAIELKKY